MDVPATATTDPAVTVDSGTRRRVVAGSFIGNFAEWFDYGVYSYFATTIANVFFPESAPQTAILATFAVFAISFVARPVGAFVWGHVGDRIGRRSALSTSILMMTGATVLIAFIPGYVTIGWWAPALLLLFRVIQGFSAAGEYAGASAYLTEYAPEGRRGLFGAVVPASTSSGLLLGSLLATVLSGWLTTDQMIAWGWRLPFLLAAPLGLVGFYIRGRLEDTPAFVAAQNDQATETGTPAMELFRYHWRAMLIALGAALLNAVGFYVVLTYLPTYLTTQLEYDATLSSLATTLSLVAYIALIFVSGNMSDRIGRRRTLLVASALFVILTVPAFLLLDMKIFWVILLVEIALGAMLTLNDGVLPSFLSEIFPTSVRYSGFAVSFNIANAVFGGTAPFMATLLITWSGSLLAPGFYLMAAAAISFVSVLAAKETSFSPLRHR